MANDEKTLEHTSDQDIAVDREFTGGDKTQSEPQSEEYVNPLDEGSVASVGDQDFDPEMAEWKDKYTRLVAEFDNYKKRTSREKLEILTAGGEDVVRSLLEVLDDMDRALEAIEGADDLEAVKQGILLIDNKLRGKLKSRGLAEIEAVGNELDTDLHEAVARIEATEDAHKGRIIDVVQKGYRMGERIIRHAKVVVGH